MARIPVRFLVVGVFCVVSLVLVGTVSSNAGGAPSNTAKDGCTCHGPASGDAAVSLQAPTEYVPGGVYDLKVSVNGPMALPPPVGMNAGGFALEVSDGTLSGSTGVLAEGTFATHTAAGNDRRSWDLKWTAPPTGKEVTFYASANAVNGDQTAGQLDRWNKVAPIAKARAVNTNTSVPSSSPSPDDTPFLPVGAALIVVAAIALVRRRFV